MSDPSHKDKQQAKRARSVKLDMLSKLAAARREVQSSLPYLMPAVYSLVPTFVTGEMKTMAVSKDFKLYIHPDFIAGLSHAECATILVHEISHVMRNHHTRVTNVGLPAYKEGEALPSDVNEITEIKQRFVDWNIAGDLAINNDLREAGMPFPTWGTVIDAMGETDADLPKGKTRESLCGAFVEDMPPVFEKGRTTEWYYLKIQECRDNGTLPKHDKAAIMAGECGGAAGNPGAYDQSPQTGDKARGAEVFGEVGEDTGEGRSEADIKHIQQQVAQGVQDHIKSGRGSVPGGWARWADEMLKPPKVKWEQLLKAKLRKAATWVAGTKTPRFSRYSRRQAGVGFGARLPVVPKMMSPKPRVCVVVDTSGSMGPDELMRAVSETKAIMKSVRGNVTFMACDCKNTTPTAVSNIGQLRELLRGGGGTDFRPPFVALDKQGGLRPHIVVFITDGCGPAPEVKPPFHVVWLLVGKYKARPTAGAGNSEIQWGEFVEVDDD